MLSINGKKFMNISEAVQWLLDNNALPFQSTANYVADTVIAKTTIVNPSPAEIRIGSLVLFADGIVGTVSGITTNGFMVGAESTDLSDGVPHITGITINASNRLIFTMSEGDPIDAGLIKEVSSFSIDASQHLIVNYNDGTTNDLGAIFQGDVNIAGNLTADSIIENMSGYSFSDNPLSGITQTTVYAGVVKNGNKLTFVHFLKMTRASGGATFGSIDFFSIPSEVANKIYPTPLGGVTDVVAAFKVYAYSDTQNSVALNALARKGANGILFFLYGLNNLTDEVEYQLRFEITLLLSENLAA